MSETKVYTGDGHKIEVGTRVEMYGMTLDDDQLEVQGIVISISDPDGDVNDHGASVAINPYVTVRFDGGEQDRFHTVVRGDSRQYYPDREYEYECEDLNRDDYAESMRAEVKEDNA